ncbi:dihydrodipicolinate synthetase [Kwoniella mangroviensis CBS 10435]|uniref:Dihydrodipicolinate synthetase n=1 Tax=Kwoniella mangroviensis CBS 10435 TaxID=1331196 RepID=A0A1B9J321_9TREE|nr:dihydrodipicolinate synthetase [Kwoniella mangroviensis CBS 8507]OCF62188.1 dihydrodipicolinate synthetase [Kwoniella mangroviensis CBS 10435]OCF64429.1 dihydrodipicolinate synthetase [Kwoniella mangroviensis CBS 8507]OCF73241.1 dihydrodipicolinate synthetase [Kwoniella mangroviensis CBS 8886]
MAAVNGHSRVLKPGVWAPIPTFFDEQEELDLDTFRKHVVKLAKVGMQPVICGSMGEAFHLTDDERFTLFKESRKALDEAGLHDTVIIAGTGGNSTRQTIRLSKLAAEAGADVVIVIPPGYYAGALQKPALKQFFLDVQEASPIPVMIYNFPGAAGGIDMDSDLINSIATEGSNICGVKLTCGAVGKLTRITGKTAVQAFSSHPRKNTVAPEFLTLGGFADFLAPAILGGRGHGAIMGLGNIYPRSLVRLFELSYKIVTDSNPSAEDIKKAWELQDLVSEADASFTRGGIAGTKYFLQKNSGHPNRRMRRPILDYTDAAGASLEKEDGVTGLLAFEKALEKGQ